MSKALSTALSLKRRTAPDDPTLPAILEFQWPSTAIVNAPVPRSARGIVWVVASMVLALIIISALIPIDRVVTAQGIVVSKSPTILVQPLDTAIVRSIDVHEGQQVKAGQLLARLDPTFAAADLATLAAQVSSFDAQVARLQAEAEGKPFSYTGTDPDWVLQASIYANRKAEFDSKLDNYRHRLDELAAVTSRAESDAAGYRERLGVAKNIEEMRKQLEAMDSGSKLNTLQATDTRAEVARSLANSEKTAEGAKLDQAALAAERDAYVQGWRATASQQLSDISGKANDAREQLNKAKLRRQLVELRSDVDAIVQSVAKVSVGSVMQSGQHFITLVPNDAPLEVEANISGRENGFVHVHDPVVDQVRYLPLCSIRLRRGHGADHQPRQLHAASRGARPHQCDRSAADQYRTLLPLRGSRSTKWHCTTCQRAFVSSQACR